jgi:hypothetical protein
MDFVDYLRIDREKVRQQSLGHRFLVLVSMSRWKGVGCEAFMVSDVVFLKLYRSASHRLGHLREVLSVSQILEDDVVIFERLELLLAELEVLFIVLILFEPSNARSDRQKLLSYPDVLLLNDAFLL